MTSSTATPTLTPNMRLALRDGATLSTTDDGAPMLEEGHVRMRLPGAAEALALVERGCSEDELLSSATTADEMLQLQLLRVRLETAGWITRTVLAGEGDAPLASLRPMGHKQAAGTRVVASSTELVLSRFALVRIDGGEVIVESPSVSVQVVLHEPWLAGAVATFSTGTSAESADIALPEGRTCADLVACLQLLVDSGALVTPGSEDGRGAQQWSFADRLFHARTRAGSNIGGYGGTFHQAGRFPALPAVREPWPEALRFDTPDPGTFADAPFSDVLEARSSVRTHDDEHPLTAAQLGEFLWRCARQRRTFESRGFEVSDRPYPSGGAIHELEIYPLVRGIDGLGPGLYHYDAEHHALGLVSAPSAATTLLLEYGKFTGAMQAQPQVVLLVAARTGRTSWKYESIAYALTLKHVGVLYQTMYLVATAMGLAPCALGGGNSDAFAAATGIDQLEEALVGEFLLGSRPETEDSD